MVWYGAPSTPRQCVPVTEGGGFIQHLPDAREASGRPVNQRLFEDGFACAGVVSSEVVLVVVRSDLSHTIVRKQVLRTEYVAPYHAHGTAKVIRLQMQTHP
jgi:hypothetical protein